MNRATIAVTYSSPELEGFTLWRNMFEGVVAAGGTPLAIDTSVPLPEIDSLVGRVDGLIIGGGGDVDPRRYGGDPQDPTIRGVNPDRDANETTAWRTARALGMPVLAICRGAQLLAAELGGELYADLARDYGTVVRHRSTEEALIAPAHDVTLTAGSTISQWHSGSTRIAVNSQHHQGIRRLPVGATATAHSDDGLIEAYELSGSGLVAVQWHPEVLWKSDPLQQGFLAHFVASAAKFASAKAGDAEPRPNSGT